MKQAAIIFISLFMALSVGSYALAAPELPCSQTMRFDGTFHYFNDNTKESVTREISGVITFELQSQVPDPVNENLDHVGWLFKMRTFDDYLAATGGLDNEEGIGWPSIDNPPIFDCSGCWDVMGDIQESYTGTTWQSFFGASVSVPWNLETNENFLPSELNFGGAGPWESGSGTPGQAFDGDQFWVDITLSPYFDAPIK